MLGHFDDEGDSVPASDSSESSSHITLRGVDFGYSDEGSGPVAISAHGLSSSRRNNRLMGLAEFSEVAETHRLISYDARGHGESAGTSGEQDYTWQALADDLLAFAAEFSPETPVSAIGSSMGTGTLVHAVTRRPDRFDRIVLTAPPTAWETRAGQAGVYRGMADLFETSSPEVIAGMMAQAPVPPIFQGLPNYPPVPDIRDGLVPTVFRGAAATDLPPLDAIAGITLPTLILAWAGDPGHPVETAERLHAAIAGSQLHVSATPAELATWGRRAADFLNA